MVPPKEQRIHRERCRAVKEARPRRSPSRSLGDLCLKLSVLGALACSRVGAGDGDSGEVVRPGYLPFATNVDAVLPREFCFDAIQLGDTVSVLLEPGQFQRTRIRDEMWPRRFAMRLRWARVQGLGQPALVPFSGDVNGAPIDPTIVTFFLPDLSRWGGAKPGGCVAAGGWLPGSVLQRDLVWTGPTAADRAPAAR